MIFEYWVGVEYVVVFFGNAVEADVDVDLIKSNSKPVPMVSSALGCLIGLVYDGSCEMNEQVSENNGRTKNSHVFHSTDL